MTTATVHGIDDAVRLRNVCRGYGNERNRVVALDDVSVGFGRSTFTAVMGPSGSGKTTLLQCAAGLDRPDSGSVSLDGMELAGLSEKELTRLRRDRIGFIFQAFNLLPALSVADNVALPLRLAGRRPGRESVERVLEQVGLGARSNHRPGELSGGQQQRVAIARALITRPAVLFGDEPTGALDTRTAVEILRLLRQAVHNDGQTAVMVTHDPVAASYADRVLFLADGRIVDELSGASADTIAERMTRLGAWGDSSDGSGTAVASGTPVARGGEAAR
ncbi:ABC transporter ATP-binding protein [Kitasatospora sp. NPDC001261]|uniref:ABC transporter ATP-binding protein n=1 Tax=Kitasatospora sp. NPDC001261 TaxID=3364012 RepID=UPI0036950DF4